MFYVILPDSKHPRGTADHDQYDHSARTGDGYTVWETAGVNYTVVRSGCPSRRSAAAVVRERRKKLSRLYR